MQRADRCVCVTDTDVAATNVGLFWNFYRTSCHILVLLKQHLNTLFFVVDFLLRKTVPCVCVCVIEEMQFEIVGAKKNDSACA